MKIAVCGSAPSSAHLAPYQDKSAQAFAQGRVPTNPGQYFNDDWEIWGCSPGLYGIAPRVTRWFELHRWEPGAAWFSPEYVQYLKNFKGPVYTGGPIPEIPNHVVYPIESVENEFSAFFLTSSLSLMAAVAILEIEQVRKARKAAKIMPVGDAAQPAYREAAIAMLPPGVDPAELDKTDADDEIGFWGVDMSANEEYSRQKPGCWYFGIQILERGMGLFYPPESDLFLPEPIYGLCEWDHEYIKATARMREFNGRISAAQQQITAATAEMAFVSGARDDMGYIIKTWMGNKYGLQPGVVLRKVK